MDLILSIDMDNNVESLINIGVNSFILDIETLKEASIKHNKATFCTSSLANKEINVFLRLPRLVNVNNVKEYLSNNILDILQNKSIKIAGIIHLCTEDSEQLHIIKNSISDLCDKKVTLVATIGNKNGVQNINEIINESDIILLDREELILEVDACKLPIIQQRITQKVKEGKKQCIIGMDIFKCYAMFGVINRAEISDVAFCQRQGASGIILTDNFKNSKYINDGVNLIMRIIKEERREGLDLHNL